MGKKRKNYLGYVDAPAQPDIEYFEQSGTYDTATKKVKTTLTPVYKKTEFFDTPNTPSSAPPPATVDDVEEDEDKPKRKQGGSVMMRIFRAAIPDIEQAIFETKTHAQVRALSTEPRGGDTAIPKCPCNKPALFRCPECGIQDMACAQCIVKAHPGHLLHHIEMWDGTAFVRANLFQLGHELHVGHGGRRCPHLHPENQGKEFVLVDCNGIHTARIFFCSCTGAPARHIQLILARLFPATITDPQTALTFGVLHHFHVQNLTCKLTALDYYRSLQKLMDNVFPQTVPDRYREFLRVVRVWRHLAMRRRSGQAQGIDDVITNRPLGSLVVRCPACPEINFNVEKEVVDAAPPEKKHLFTLFLSSDGNFKLQRKNKVDDPDDVALNDGHAYFPNDEKYKQYCSQIPRADDKCTCSELKAVRMQNIAKFKNSVISGVVAVQCARHGFFMPGGMVDLLKGEGYAHTDFALGHALGDAYDQRWIILSYDVYCQYYKRITERFGKWFPGMADMISRMSGVVPKMHIRNHVAQCQTQWSTNFSEFLAFLIGELIEGSWAELNQFAGSTKEQNHGHRHDSLDDGCGQWNWDKFINMAQTLLRLFREAKAAIRKRVPAFEKLTLSTDPALIAEWQAMPRKWTWDKETKVYSSPYEANIKNGPPTHRSEYERLLKAELARSLAQETVLAGETEYIARGLRLEKDQHRIMVTKKTSVTDEATGARSRLRKELNTFRARQFEQFPELRSRLGAVDAAAPELEPLFLPSAFPQHEMVAMGMAHLAETEYQLRRGAAYDALEDVRVAIKSFNFNLAFKIANIDGQSANTRAQNFLRILANDRIVSADDYRRARLAMLNLGMKLEDERSLQPLSNDELYAKNTREMPKMGESHKVDPWFWSAGRPEGVTEEKWSVEMDRVKWFRDRANCDRAVEQVELVEAEFDRSITAYRKHAESWTTIRQRSSTTSGHAAYAHLKVGLYSKLADQCAAVKKSAPARSEEDAEAEEKAAEEDLKQKGLLNKQMPQKWEDYLTVM